MFDKIEINNDLICMKKTIQKAKVFVSQKLIKKLKDLKTKCKTDTQPKNLKFVGRTEKIENILKQLKQTNNLQLASQVLTFRSDPQRILTNATSTIDNLLLAHLCAQKLLQTEVRRLKDKYNLDSVPNWHASILAIGKKKQKRIAKVEVTRKIVERKAGEKERRDLSRKRNEWLVENLKPGDLPNCALSPIVDVVKEVAIRRPKPAPKKEAPIQKLPKDLPVKFATKPAKECVPQRPIKNVDSFFITGSGQNYLSTAVVDRVQAPTPNDGLDRRERRAQQFGPSKGSHTRPPVQARFTNQKQRSQVNGSTASSPAIGLHPSWAAKQKTKGIATFQGKKMKFDDTIDVAPAAGSAKASTTQSQQKLHPSWAAKQKQKPIISEFKGNKITFDD